MSYISWMRTLHHISFVAWYNYTQTSCLDFLKSEHVGGTYCSVSKSCPTLCDPMPCSPPGSSVPGILQERILEWVAISFSNSCMHACMLSRFSRVQLCVTPWTAAHQAPLSLGFSRQEYWSGLPFPSPEVAISRCKLVYTGWINNKVLSYSTGNYIQYPVINHNGKEYENNTSLLITILIIILSLAVASVMSNSLWPHGP